MKKKKIEVLVFIAFIGIIVWFLNHGTPMMQDDYLYATYMGDGCFSPGTPNKSLFDVVESCVSHYMGCNGRMANNLAFLVFYLGGKSLYNILATIVSLVGLLTLSRSFMGRLSFFSISFTLLCTLILFPALYHTCLWLAGAFNYLWGACLLFAAYYTLHTNYHSDKKKYIVESLGWVLLMLASCMHEMLGCSLLGALGFYALVLVCRRKKIPLFIMGAIVTVSIGAMLPLTSPGIHNRASGMEYISVAYFLKTTGLMIMRAWSTTIVFICLLLYHTWKKKIDFWYIYACVSFVLAWLMGAHNFTGCSYFYYSVAVLAWLLKTISPYVLNCPKSVQIILCMVTVGTLGWFSYVTYRIDRNISVAFALSNQNDVVVMDVDPINETEAIAYVHGLPINTAYIYPYFSKYHGIRDFFVIQRKMRGSDVSLYKKLASEESDKVVSSRAADGWIYMRFPKKKTICIFDGLRVTVMGKTKASVRVTICPYSEILHRSFFSSLYDRYVARQKFVNGGLDFYDGYVFALIPPIEGMTHIEFKMQDMQKIKESTYIHSL